MTPAQRTLLELLELSLGSDLLVQAALAHALSLSGREALPTSGPELLAFVRAHLVDTLTGELGPRLTITLLDDLAARLEPGPAEPISEVVATVPPFSGPRPVASPEPSPSRPSFVRATISILLVDAHRVARTALARALLRATWNVTVVDTHAELLLALDGGETFAVALVDARHAMAFEIVATLVARQPHAAVVARTADPVHVRSAFETLGVARLDVRSADAPAEELVDAVRRVLSGA